jgi:kynureninase
MQALFARSVVGEFLAPDILSSGFAASHVLYVDMRDTVAVLKDIMQLRAWDHPAFTARHAVT